MDSETHHAISELTAIARAQTATIANLTQTTAHLLDAVQVLGRAVTELLGEEAGTPVDDATCEGCGVREGQHHVPGCPDEGMIDDLGGGPPDDDGLERDWDGNVIR